MALEVIEKNYFRNHHRRCGTENCSAESAKQAQLQISNNGRLRPMGAISNNFPVLYIFYIEYGSWETAPWTPGRISFGKGEKMTNSGNCYACQEMWLDVPETDGRYQISNHGHLRQMRRKELLSKIMKMAADIKLQASGSWMPPIKSLQKKSECVPRRMLCRPLLKNPLL